MAHESFRREDEHRTSSNRSFGLVIAVAFLVIGVVPWLLGGKLHYWAIVVAAAFLVAALAVPAVLSPLNRIWTRFGLLLHRIVSPLVLGFMFFVVVTPIGLLMRMLAKDPLRREFDRRATSYWIERQPPGPAPESLRDQF